MASIQMIRLSVSAIGVISKTRIPCRACAKLQRLRLPHNRLITSSSILYSDAPLPSEHSDLVIEETSKKPKRKTRRKNILHDRKLNEVTPGDSKSWSEFSSSLTEDDTFGALNPEEVQQTVKRRGISAKKQQEKRKTQTTPPQSVESRVDFHQLATDPDWSSEFGSLAGEHDPELKAVEIEDSKYEDDDEEDEKKQHLPKLAPRRKYSPNWYGLQIEKLSKEGKIYECVELLETQMLKEDRVRPNEYVFTVLTGALGRVGYTKKAFEVYNQMKKFGLQPEDATYTALFNACSNSPWREDGLKRATDLRHFMQKKDIQPNLTTYKAMIKAFGRCGDIQTAFLLVDELNTLKFRADEEVFSMLMQACLTDKETGLRYAIEVWRRLHQRKKVAPNIYHYNLLLRTIKECRIGDPVAANQILLSSPAKQTLLPPSGKKQANKPESTSLTPVNRLSDTSAPSKPKTPANQTAIFSQIVSEPQIPWWKYKSEDSATSLIPAEDSIPDIETTLAMSILDAAVPDILCYRGNFGAVVGLGSLDTKEDRLALFGGLPGILQHMRGDCVSPDIKTFTQLLDMIPSTRQAERDLLAAIKAHQVAIDVDLLNLIIRRRNLRRDYTGAKDIVTVMSEHNLQANVMTYGCLAMGCRRQEEGLQLLKDMEMADRAPSVDIFSILLFQSWMDFRYKLALCQEMKRLRVRPNEAVIERIEQAVARARTAIVRKEKGLEVPSYARHEDFSANFDKFMQYYKGWLMTQPLDKEPVPWEQFSKPTPSIETPDT